MTKKTQRKKPNKIATGPSPFEYAQAAARHMVDTATKLGEHKARAKLLAPMIAALKSAADSNFTTSPFVTGTQMLALGNGDCALLLDALAEAGYVPAPQGGEEFAFPQSSTGVPGDGAQENGCNTTAAMFTGV